jgi:radical SAM superfamily enzyme YgiQ (UPF0313 family)
MPRPADRARLPATGGGQEANRMARVIHFIYLDIDTGFYPGAHHGLASLFAAVRAAGHDYRLTHLTRELSEGEFMKLIGRSDALRQAQGGLSVSKAADVFGFSAMTNQFKFVRRYAPVLAAMGRPILVGGVHATLAPEEACGVEGVTAACCGEGEIFIKRWLDAMSAGALRQAPFGSEPQGRRQGTLRNSKGADWRAIKGACYRNGGTVTCRPAEHVADLDSLPLPEYDAFNMPMIIKDLGGRLSLVVSRGCPFRCAFCCNEALRKAFGAPENYVRMRSPAGAISMTKAIIARHRPTSIRFEDDLLLANTAWRRDFLSRYRDEIALPFECNCRADVVTAELAEQLRQAGCVSVDIGVESGDERIRNEILGKDISDGQIEQAFAALRAAGLRTYSYNMLGLPFETPASARRTYELNRRIKPSAGNVFYFFPYPGTRLKELAEAHNLLRPGYDKVTSYTEMPSVDETYATHRQLRRVYRRLKMYLYLRRFRTFFPLPGWLKGPIAGLIWAAFNICPPLISLFLADTRLKRWLRRLAFRAPARSPRRPGGN